MDKSREEQIVAALGGHWGFSYGRYTYMGMAIPEPDLCGKATDRVNEAVRQRVRELWCEERRARFIRIDIGGELAVLTLMQTRIPPHMDDYDEEGVWSTEEVAEAGAWEKALLWLAGWREK